MNWNIQQLDLYLYSVSVQLYSIQWTTFSAWRHKIHPLDGKNKYVLSFQHNKQHYTGWKHTIGNGTFLENK